MIRQDKPGWQAMVLIVRHLRNPAALAGAAPCPAAGGTMTKAVKFETFVI